MIDWAEEKAREWLEETLGPIVVEHAYHQFSDAEVSSLAALLREVDQDASARVTAAVGERARVLAEVRRVVEKFRTTWQTGSSADIALYEILSRLDTL